MTDAMFTHMFGSSPDADDPIGYLLQQCYEGAITEDALNAAAKQHREATDQRKRDTPPAPVPAPAADPDPIWVCPLTKQIHINPKSGTFKYIRADLASPPPSAAPTDEISRLRRELDAAHDKYQRDVNGLNNEGDPIGGDPPMGWKQRAERAEALLAAPTDNTALKAELIQKCCTIETLSDRCRTYRPERDAALASRPVAPAAPLHGPYGWLIKPIGLAEDAWRLEDQRSSCPLEEVSVPLFAKEEQVLGKVAAPAEGDVGALLADVDRVIRRYLNALGIEQHDQNAEAVYQRVLDARAALRPQSSAQGGEA